MLKVWERMRVVFLFVAGIALVGSTAVARDDKALWDNVVWEDANDETLDTVIDGKRWEVVAVDGLPLGEIVKASKVHFSGKWQRRVGEDLPDVLEKMGHEVRESSNLTLRAQTGEIVEKPTAWSKEARARMMTRMRAAKMAELKALQSLPTQVSRAQALEDIDQYQKALERDFSYLKFNDNDYAGALNSLRSSLDDEVGTRWLGVQLGKIQSLFIDGHASVEEPSDPGGALPFTIGNSADGYVAALHDHSAYFNSEYPFVESVDGRAVDEWRRLLEPYSSKGSAQYRKRSALNGIARLASTRARLGFEEKATATIRLGSLDGARRKEIVVDLIERKPRRARWPVRETGWLEEGIGYLRIDSMSSKVAATIDPAMATFRGAAGLVVDVRGNGGGNRKALLELYPYVMDEGEAPQIVNAGAYRLSPRFDDDHLEARFMRRRSSLAFNGEKRKAIDVFMRTFQPEIAFDPSEFSDWHYLVIGSSDNPESYSFKGKIVVLMDEYCFSATDIFLGAFAPRDDVVLIGGASSGGSARKASGRLKYSNIEYGFASMASYQPDGKLYDGNGIAPDFEVLPEPSFFIADGQDNVLEAALEHLRMDREAISPARGLGPNTGK